MTTAVRPQPAALGPFMISAGHHQALRPDGREMLLPTGCVLLIVNLAEGEARWHDGPGERPAWQASGARQTCWDPRT